MLQVTVDDVGMDPAIDAAAKILAQSGRVPSYAFAVNYSYADVTATWLAQLPADAVGIHLNLTSGPPVEGSVSTLLDEATSSFSGPTAGATPSNFGNAISRHRQEVFDVTASKHDVRSELSAQWEKFRDLTNREPSFVSVHHDLDESTIVASALDELWPGKRGRQHRLLNFDLMSYVSMFVEPDEGLDAYEKRVRWSLDSMLLDPNIHLAVFHPSSWEPRQQFTVYRNGRKIEFEFLGADQTSELLRHAVSEGRL